MRLSRRAIRAARFVSRPSEFEVTDRMLQWIEEGRACWRALKAESAVAAGKGTRLLGEGEDPLAADLVVAGEGPLGADQCPGSEGGGIRQSESCWACNSVPIGRVAERWSAHQS
jgi:hypothetical protein